MPNEFSDEDAVMVEPIACAVHAALSGQVESGDTVAVIGAGTLGLGVIAALREFGATPSHLIVAAKYAHQHKFATEFGATDVCKPAELRRTVRSLTRSLAIGPVGNERLTGGANVVFDCVGSSDSIADGIAIAGPRGRIVLVGMPGNTTLDLTGLWQRELTLAGAYAYGTEDLINTGAPRRTFDLAFELVAKQQLGRLVSARYPIEHASHALDHAANAGRRGAIKVVFDHRRTSRKGTQ